MTRQIRNAAKALIIKDGKMLAIKIKDGEEEWYIMPGGGQEAEETLPQALQREVLEEVKLTFELVTVLVNLDDHVGSEVSLGYAGGSAVELVLTNLDGNVTVVCCYEAELVHNVADFTDFFFNLVNGFHFSFFLSVYIVFIFLIFLI